MIKFKMIWLQIAFITVVISISGCVSQTERTLKDAVKLKVQLDSEKIETDTLVERFFLSQELAERIAVIKILSERGNLEDNAKMFAIALDDDPLIRDDVVYLLQKNNILPIPAKISVTGHLRGNELEAVTGKGICDIFIADDKATEALSINLDYSFGYKKSVSNQSYCQSYDSIGFCKSQASETVERTYPSLDLTFKYKYSGFDEHKISLESNGSSKVTKNRFGSTSPGFGSEGPLKRRLVKKGKDKLGYKVRNSFCLYAKQILIHNDPAYFSEPDNIYKNH